MVGRGSVTGGFLNVAQRAPGVERGGDERVPQRVRSDALGNASLAGDATHDPARGVAVETFAVCADKDRPLAAFPDDEVDGAGGAGREGDSDDLAALAQDGQGAWPRSRPRAAMSAPVASETRSPFRENRLTSA
jgi:hypothetical protein